MKYSPSVAMATSGNIKAVCAATSGLAKEDMEYQRQGKTNIELSNLLWPKSDLFLYPRVTRGRTVERETRGQTETAVM